MIHVQDIGDERLADYRGLRDPARRGRVEREGGFFVAEGLFVVERLLASGLELRSVLLSEGKLRRLEAPLRDIGAPVYVVDRDAMEAIVGFDLHRGVLASANRPAEPPVSALAGLQTICVLEGINDHENLGAIARSAAALGAHALVLDPTCADPWYRRSVRVSMGAMFGLPILRDPSWPGMLTSIRDLGFRVLAMTVSDAAVPITEVESGPPTAVLLGAEGRGLTDVAIGFADQEVVIPISPDVDSLNVGHAAAIAFHRLGALA